MHLPLDQTEIRNVFLASQRILSAGNLEELRREALLILQNLLQADKGNFFLATEDPHRSSIDLGKVFSRGVTDKSLRLFRQYYHQLDPFNKVLNTQSPRSQVITFKQIIPFAKLLKTEYYNDFLKPQNIHDQLAIYLMSGNQFLGVAALFRPKDAPVFSSADNAKAKLIAPILTAAMERAISIKKSRELEQAIQSIAIELPYDGIVILDTSLRPVYYNNVAAGIISMLHRLMGQNRSFPPDLPDPLHTAALRLASALQGAVPRKLPQMDPIILTTNSAKKVIAHLRVVINEKSTPLILICFNPSSQPSTTDTLLKQQGISPRELDIIHLLADGKKNSEIAEVLFISEYTVENHLRAIYRKMDVKNRTALVHKLYTAA
jgi:DNA-binding CsgD family transcriptional regulator